MEGCDMSTGLIPADQKTALEAAEVVANQYGLAAIENSSPLERTLMISTGIAKLKQLLTPELMKPIMALQGTSLGFRTDKDSSGGYPLEAVRDVTCEAMLRGFRMIGNETNIIAGRFYAAKDGCRRRVLEWPGLTEFIIEISFPQDKGGTAYVEGMAFWKLNGVPDQLERRGKTSIPIRRNAGMLDDAILGKAERKMYAAVLNRLSSFVIPDGEVDAEAVSPGNGSEQPKRSSLNDYADAGPEVAEPPKFDPEDQKTILEQARKQIADAKDVKVVSAIQKDVAAMSREGRVSPETLSAINAAANERRRVLRGELY
jgi:hypothetical protein